MNSKLFIGFDKRRLDTTYSYLVKENIFHHLTRKKIPFTTDPHEEFSDAVFASAEELSFFYPTILKKNARISIFALSCKDDYLIDPRNPNKITLTQNAYNYYLRADKILVSLDSQAQFLARQGITKNVVITKPFLTFAFDEKPSDTIKNAFKSFYQIPKNKKVVISLGQYQNQEELDLFNGIARINPEYTFLFFGEEGKDSVKVKLLQRLAINSNTQYLKIIPEVLYQSALVSADAFFIPQKNIMYPTTIIDFMAHKVPIIAYKNNNYRDLINENTAIIANNFTELYHSFRSLFSINKSQEAYEYVKRFANY